MINESAIVNFLREVITSDTITNKMRQTALDLRDSITLKGGTFIDGHVFTLSQLHELRAMQKIPAIKLCREWTGWGLRESKDFVDNINNAIITVERNCNED